MGKGLKHMCSLPLIGKYILKLFKFHHSQKRGGVVRSLAAETRLGELLEEQIFCSSTSIPPPICNSSSLSSIAWALPSDRCRHNPLFYKSVQNW
jgi:hypothetical protein